MVKVIVILTVLIINPVLAMDDDNNDHSAYFLEIVPSNIKHASDKDVENIARAITYFLGSSSPHLQRSLIDIAQRRIHESQTLQDDIRAIPIDFSIEDLQSHDDQIRRYVDIKKLVGECVEEALKVRDRSQADLEVKLLLEKKFRRQDKYKLYTAVATSGLSLAGIVITFLTTYFSK